MNTIPDEFTLEAARQIVYGDLFDKSSRLPTAEQVAAVIEQFARPTRLRQALVVVKRSLDAHATNPQKLELLKSDWAGSMRIANEE